MYEKLVDLSEKSKQSSTMIVSQTKVIQFNTEDMNEYKKKELRTWRYKMIIFARIVILRRGLENRKDIE